jgi:hypothetical protein
MSEEIKPVAWYLSKDPEQEQEPFMTTDGLLASSYEQLGWRRSPLIATHRIVPVELLERCSREFQSMEGTELAYPEHASAVQCYHELRAIIDKEPT